MTCKSTAGRTSSYPATAGIGKTARLGWTLEPHGTCFAPRSRGRDHRRHDGPGPFGRQGLHCRRSECRRLRPQSGLGGHGGAGIGLVRAVAGGRCRSIRRRPTAAIRLALDAFGRFDALYHVAGGSGRRAGDGPLHEVTDDGIETTLQHNLTSLIYSNRAAAQTFLEHGHGRVGAEYGQRSGLEPLAAVLRHARLRRRQIGDHRFHQELRRLLRTARHPLQRDRSGTGRHADGRSARSAMRRFSNSCACEAAARWRPRRPARGPRRRGRVLSLRRIAVRYRPGARGRWRLDGQRWSGPQWLSPAFARSAQSVLRFLYA